MRKRMKGLLSAALAVSVMLSMAACGGSQVGTSAASDAGTNAASEANGGSTEHREVVYGSASMITSFDMKNITSANDLQAADQVYDTLVRKINHEIVGYLAESYEIF